MPRIAGVNIPDNKRIEVAITYIYGVGRSLSKEILAKAQIDPNKKAQDLTPKELNDLKDFIEKQPVNNSDSNKLMAILDICTLEYC